MSLVENTISFPLFEGRSCVFKCAELLFRHENKDQIFQQLRTPMLLRRKVPIPESRKWELNSFFLNVAPSMTAEPLAILPHEQELLHPPSLV